MAELLDQLTAIDALDPEAKRLLMADLREAKPENWPLLVQQFRTALAYRQQLAEREQLDVPAVSAPFAEAFAAGGSPPQTVETPPAAPPAAVVGAVESAAPLQLSAAPTQSLQARANPQAMRLPQPPSVKVLPMRPVAQQVSYVTDGAARAPHDWQSDLQGALQGLAATVQSEPGTAEEVNQHFQLRLMQLLAGDQEASLQPVPGATAAQQDYWNKQLFALSTYLDGAGQPDSKRRAAATLLHLDQARAKLAEQATLQVHRLSLVDAVEGYGAYQPRQETKFRPGDQVTLYAEIENFSSESTEGGYRTRLATSYEVVDKNGKRVDSAEFPEVEDLCRTVRRDFHMQYTVTLPTRIYPDAYEIRLTVTDQQSAKIGQASVPLEIID